MRICLVAPLVAAIDEHAPQLGGVQSVVADLAGGLADAGHDVTLVAPRGSYVQGAHVVDLGIDASRFAPAVLDHAEARVDDAAQREAFARIRAWVDGRSFDAVHAHAYDAPAFAAVDGPRAMHTLHLPPIDPSVVTAARGTKAALVTVSRANADAWTKVGVRVAAAIHNGIDVARVPVGRGDGGYVVAAGRIAPEKGIEAAARAARAAGVPLRVVGAVYEPSARGAIGEDGVTFTGPVARGELFRIVGAARALLMPVRWDEPFGLVAVEAMAAGTPVVAYRRGGLPEVVADGETGYLVAPGDEAALADAVRRSGGIDRAACRARAEDRFTARRMVDGYVAAYLSAAASASQKGATAR